MSEINNSSPVPRQDLEAIAVRVRNAHAGVVHATANLLDHAMTAGAALIEAQLQVPDGEWVSWLEKHCDFRLRTAQVYMQLARRRSDLEGQHTAPRSLRGALAALNRSDRARFPTTSHRTTKTPQSRMVLNSLAWAGAAPQERTHFLNGVGYSGLLAAVPAEWDLEGYALRAVSPKRAPHVGASLKQIPSGAAGNRPRARLNAVARRSDLGPRGRPRHRHRDGNTLTRAPRDHLQVEQS